MIRFLPYKHARTFSVPLSLRTRAFVLVCEYLSHAPRRDIKEETFRASTLPPSFWTEFVGLATDHMVGPTLAIRFERLGLSGTIPALVERYCNAILRMNRRRNAKLYAEAIEAAKHLNKIDVVPVFLKGGATMFSHLYDDPGIRIMSDLDILVPGDRARDCERVLSELGYGRAPIPRHPREHTIGIFLGSDAVAPIDLHHEVLAYPNEKLLSAREAVEDSVVQERDGATVAVPSPTHQAVIDIGHAQLTDHGYRYGYLPLRPLQDFALLLRKSPDLIDWPQIKERFAAIGKWKAADYHCLAVYETLAVRPYPDYVPSVPARILVGRARFFVGHPTLQRIWYRLVRLAQLIWKETSDKELRVRLLGNMRSPAWWRRHLTIFWEGRR